MLEVEISIEGENPTQTEAYRLDREATALKKAGDMEGAVAALRKRKALMGLEYRDDKLAKYLQAAGRFNEAMTEIEWLLASCHSFALQSFAHQPNSVIQSQRCHHMAAIHGAAVLICQREKRHDLKAIHEQRRDAYMQLREKLEPLARAESKQLREQGDRAVASCGSIENKEFFQQRQERIARNKMEAARLMP